jgi:hypothetical protein
MFFFVLSVQNKQGVSFLTERRKYMSTREKLASLIGPLLLIAAGILLLLNQLDVIAVDLWSLFFGLWPLLIMATALSMILNGGSLFLPLTLLAFSGGFLLSNYDLVAWHMWELFGRLWPLLVIAFGLDILLLPRIGLAAIRTDAIDAPLGISTSVDLSVESGIGKLAVDCESGGDKLFTATATVGQGEHLGHKLRMKNAGASVKIKRSAQWYYPFTGAWAGGRSCQVSLNPALPTSLKIDGGIGNKVLDLRRARLIALKLEGGIGSKDIILPAHGSLAASIESGVGDTTIRIPAGLAVRVHLDSGLGSRQVQGNLIQISNGYVSADYDSAENRADIKVDQGLGGLTIVEID